MPRAMLSCVSVSMCSRISSSSCCNMRLRRNMISLLIRGPENARDGPCELVPLAGLEGELPPPLAGQTIKFGAAIVFRGALLDRNPSALDEPVQRGVQRPLFHLQHIVRVEFDRLSDGVSVRRPPEQCTQNQQIQSALQQFDAFLLFFSRHPR